MRRKELDLREREDKMPKLLRKCIKCGTYTLNPNFCPKCGSEVRLAHPPKFSPADKYGVYRRLMKKSIKKSD